MNIVLVIYILIVEVLTLLYLVLQNARLYVVLCGALEVVQLRRRPGRVRVALAPLPLEEHVHHARDALHGARVPAHRGVLRHHAAAPAGPLEPRRHVRDALVKKAPAEDGTLDSS